MPLFEDIILTEAIEIKAMSEKIFNYLTGVVDDESFKTLNAYNVSFNPDCAADIVARVEKPRRNANLEQF